MDGQFSYVIREHGKFNKGISIVDSIIVKIQYLALLGPGQNNLIFTLYFLWYKLTIFAAMSKKVST